MAAEGNGWSRWQLIMIVTCAGLYYRLGSGTGTDDSQGSLAIDGISFPSEVKMGGVVQQVTGGGTRTKYGVAKVYAAALYLDSRGASSALKSYANGKPPTKQAFFDAVIKGTFAKTLLLQFHRSVDRGAVAGALSDSLKPRLGKKAVEAFREALLSVCPEDVVKGSQLFFMCKGETLHIGLGSPDVKQTIKDKGACAALWDVYYGKDPISAPLKSGMAAGFAQRLYAAGK